MRVLIITEDEKVRNIMFKQCVIFEKGVKIWFRPWKTEYLGDEGLQLGRNGSM